MANDDQKFKSESGRLQREAKEHKLPYLFTKEGSVIWVEEAFDEKQAFTKLIVNQQSADISDKKDFAFVGLNPRGDGDSYETRKKIYDITQKPLYYKYIILENNKLRKIRTQSTNRKDYLKYVAPKSYWNTALNSSQKLERENLGNIYCLDMSPIPTKDSKNLSDKQREEQQDSLSNNNYQKQHDILTKYYQHLNQQLEITIGFISYYLNHKIPKAKVTLCYGDQYLTNYKIDTRNLTNSDQDKLTTESNNQRKLIEYKVLTQIYKGIIQPAPERIYLLGLTNQCNPYQLNYFVKKGLHQNLHQITDGEINTIKGKIKTIKGQLARFKIKPS